MRPVQATDLLFNRNWIVRNLRSRVIPTQIVERDRIEILLFLVGHILNLMTGRTPSPFADLIEYVCNNIFCSKEIDGATIGNVFVIVIE